MQEWYVYILGLRKGVLFRGVLISVMYVCVDLMTYCTCVTVVYRYSIMCHVYVSLLCVTVHVCMLLHDSEREV